MRDVLFFLQYQEPPPTHTKWIQQKICAREKYFVYLLCKNNVFFVSKIIFLCVCIQNEKSEFFEWHSTNIDDDEVKEKNKKKKKKYPVFCTYTITTIQFYEDFIYSYKGHRPTVNDEKSKWQTILLPFLRFFLSSERNKKIQSREITEFFLRLLEFLKGFDLRILLAFGIVHTRKEHH